jgi:hypothetical protein
MFLLAATTLSSSAFASGPCSEIGSPDECAKYPSGQCFWDATDQRCESRSNNEDGCSRIRSRTICALSIYCSWDNEDQRCEKRF